MTFILFVLGLCFGSFLLVLIDRLPRGISPFVGRSKCDHCQHTLAANDLVPILSYLLTRGRCRYCHKKLSLWYPVFELLTGILFAATPYLLNLSSAPAYGIMTLLYTLFIVSNFLIIFMIDLRFGIIPFIIVIPATVVSLFYLLATSPSSLLPTLLAATCASIFFYLIYLATRGRGMGFGDVVLAFYLGMVAGFPGIGITLYVAFLTGAAVSLILIFTGKKKMKGGTIPFGPFLILGAFLAYFWEAQILSLISFLLAR